jgi:hypothetical protein
MIRSLKQLKINFINDCNCQVDYNELEKALLWRSKKPISKTRHIYLHGDYPAVAIGKTKIHIHRLLMMFWLKTNLPSDFYVHHIDGNKLNAKIDNLILVHSVKHQSEHNKGKVLSKEHRRKIADKNKLRKGKRRNFTRKDVTTLEVFQMKQKGMSFNQISLKLNLDWGCVKQRYNDFIHDNPELLEE